MPPITFALILLNVLVYALELATGPDIIRVFGLWPPGSGGVFHLWQLVTYSFLHGSLMHLGFNMFAVWMFGAALETRWNDLRYLLTYLLSVVVAAMTQIVVSGFFLHSSMAVIGASGGVFGLLLAYALYFPRSSITIVFLPFIRIPARTFVLGYGIVELLLGLTNTDAGVAHFAHLGGLFGGWLGVQYFRGRGVFGQR
ncbi:rhomboid family intramembrane serine protease [Thiobacillus sedimenti]|uniref:Rhomboid family intramembrane serine protease n=1 Tax=Thiobacillus sedimenti TaxID=3110231 RepID=A0ABZ1CGT6_9PROT|nr:rhomboid family intramembrane serine protease [Thiobacillus sp. SCUT-2]WRS38315.1 rhomboid family intramembrane serine protease [Thiobacillus sp. SCUT-2]